MCIRDSHEADRAAAVVAGHEIGALADQLDHQHRVGEYGQQLITAARARRQIEVARTCARRSADPARGMTGRSDAELARGGTVRDPAGAVSYTHLTLPTS